MAPLRTAFLAASLVLGVALLSGCGKKGSLVPPEALAPAPVSNLALAQKGKNLQVSWSAPSNEEGGEPLRDLAGFVLFKGVILPPEQDCEECPSAFSQLARIDLQYPQGVRRVGSLFLLNDAEIATGRSYRYKIRSFTTDGGQSRDSNVARWTVAVPPAPPVLQASASDTGVTLTFTAPAPEEGSLIGYNVYRSEPGQEMPLSPLNAQPITATTFEERDLLVGEGYSYTVTALARAHGETVESVPSNRVDGAIPARD